jgi:hypothetical protein
MIQIFDIVINAKTVTNNKTNSLLIKFSSGLIFVRFIAFTPVGNLNNQDEKKLSTVNRSNIETEIRTNDWKKRDYFYPSMKKNKNKPLKGAMIKRRHDERKAGKPPSIAI